MRTVMLLCVCVVNLVLFLGPFFRPAYACERGVLFEDRGILFGKSQVLEVYQGVALTVPCAPGQWKIPEAPKKFDI